ncbi:MAG TPA: hypothetical protein VHZ78_09965 [Rhizomicrobium sp.]|jgi:hypothetical protein|nr:hypothetical protein [Rhizomicrobium sp.]
MEKVPVGRSISHAYEFLFGRVFQIIGTAWLPALLYAAGTYFWLQNAVSWMAPLSHDQATLTRGIAATAGFAGLALVTRAVLGISLTQEALGIRHDIQFAHFVVGPREIRLVFAQIRLMLLVLVLYVVTIAVIVLGIGAAIKYGTKIPHVPMVGGTSLVVIGAVIAAVLLYVAFVLTVLKLSFLINAVASVERHASIRRGWHLASGSGWRILIVLLSVGLPLAVVAWGAMYFMLGSGLAGVAHAAPGVARMHALLQFYADNAAVIAIIAGIGTVVGSALLAGATAAAYRTVTGHEEPEPADDDALVAPLLAPVVVPAVVHEEEPLPAVPDHGHEDHGHGHHGHQEDHGHKDHGHDDSHGHGGHEDHGHKDHGHGDSHGHREDAHGHDDDESDDDESDDDGDDSHDDGHGHDDHGHKSHDDHGHGGHGHDDHGHGDHGHHTHAA